MSTDRRTNIYNRYVTIMYRYTKKKAREYAIILRERIKAGYYLYVKFLRGNFKSFLITLLMFLSIGYPSIKFNPRSHTLPFAIFYSDINKYFKIDCISIFCENSLLSLPVICIYPSGNKYRRCKLPYAIYFRDFNNYGFQNVEWEDK